MPSLDKIIVLDFGSQYTHLLARRIREIGVYSEILLPSASTKELKKARGIILSGGPASVYDKNAPKFNSEIFNMKIPILGLCYGQQLIGQVMGGKVEAGSTKEYGTSSLIVSGGKLFDGLPKEFTVWMSHGDAILELPQGFISIASTKDCKYAAIANDSKKFYGLQFHPEVTHTENGLKILSNFVFSICGCKNSWSMKDYLKQEVMAIRKEFAGKKVFLLLSGGVDSVVALALIGKALGSERIFALHIDTGFMRKDESKNVKEEVEKLDIKKIFVKNAGNEFISALKGISNPEEKRRIIGDLFIEIAVGEMKKLGFDDKEWLLGQGTIYPDTIETGGTANSNKIKTHHNRVPIIVQMIEQGKIIEPLKYLYKDEVRIIGKLLDLPQILINRRPFPGPGLAIRILCSDGKDTADYSIEGRINSKIKHLGFNAKLLPVKAVGVQGDNRTYKNAVMLEGKLDYKKIEEASTMITNSFSMINKVVFLVSPLKAQKILVKEEYLSKARILKLQEADNIATIIADQTKQALDIWQFPVVLLPLDFNDNGEVIVLRPVSSKEAMTAKFYPLEKEVLTQIVDKILKIKGIGAVMLDVTHKPPATIEWE